MLVRRAQRTRVPVAFLVTRKDKSHKHKPSTVVVATANVGTMRPGRLKRLNASSRCVTPRCEELSVKFAEAGLHAVMFQETRLQVKGIASTSKYDLFRSRANEQGLDGTHVWLDKDAGFSVQASVAQHRRIMAVTAKICCTCWLLVSRHAPVEDSPYEDKCEFYEQLEKVLSPAVGTRFPIVLGIDTNGVLGSFVSESVGVVNASHESTA